MQPSTVACHGDPNCETGYYGSKCYDVDIGCLCDPPVDFFSGYFPHPKDVNRPYASCEKYPCKYGNTFPGLLAQHMPVTAMDDVVNSVNVPSRPKSMQLVNSWNGWDPLEEIIVGTFENGRLFAVEDTWQPHPRFMRDLEYYGLSYPADGNFGDDSIQQAIRCQENLVKLLKNENIIVRRPDAIPFGKEVKTPLWDCDRTNSTACPRDVLITLGNTIVEAPVNMKSRYFEYVAYRTLLNEYFHRDANFRWIAAPKPSMTRVMIRKSFDWHDEVKRAKQTSAGDCLLTEHEPAFDAASILRMGKDLIVLRDVRTNLSGITWLQRQFRGQFRIHPIFIPNDSLPWHIDGDLLCLREPQDGRPGVIVTNADRSIDPCYKNLFGSDWEIVTAPLPNHSRSPKFCSMSVWLSMNCLMTGPSTIVVEQTEKNMINFCESYGMRVLQVDFRDAYFTGGGLHCATLDIRRRGHQKDYLPSLNKRIEQQREDIEAARSKFIGQKAE